jgi:phthalate 4,5-dioxygenase oxygenase subunit
MLARDHIDLTRVGPGSVMGQFMRQYWLPAAMSSELKQDGTPMRLMLLGEKLIAFRDSTGRIGVLDHKCPHRCASLFLGRNEEGGIRCIYHGWKFDVDGKCLNMPSVPAHSDFKHKIQAKAYKTAERNGLIWVYMGDESQAPELPAIEATLIPGSQIWCLQRECNWLQALEGDIDTSHVGFLHVGSLNADDLDDDHPMRPTVLNRAPEYRVANADWGTMYGAYRRNDDGRMSWRVAHFMFPFWTQTPNIRFATRAIARAWVPMDDEHVMLFDITGGADEGNPVQSTRKDGQPLFGGPIQYAPNTTDWFGRWRSMDNSLNDWGIDRESQRTHVQYSGIANVSMQDQSVTESMGAITDHAAEHLAPTDQMITRTRRRLLTAARSLREDFKTPPGIHDPQVFFRARSGSYLHDPSVEWEEAYRHQLDQAMRWPGQLAEPAE